MLHIGTKSIAQPDNPARVERYDIEAARGQGAAPVHQVMLRREHEPTLFVRANARCRSSKLAAAPRTHFHEYECARAADLAHDKVDFATTTREIARHEAQPLTL